MTTTPIGPSVPAIDQGAPGSPGSASGGDVFLALVQGILEAEPALPQPVAPQVADPCLGTAAANPEDAQSVGDNADPTLAITAPDPVLAALSAGLVPTLVAPAAPATLEGGPATPTAGTVSGLTTESAPADAATMPLGTAPDARQVQPGPGPADADPPAAAISATEDEPAGAPAGTTTGSTPSVSSAPAPAAPAPAVTTVAAPNAPAPVGGSAPATVAPVARQVFPEIVKLTTSTEGPQRVTIRLNPESLGEVRVVLTERRGVLEVSLSANSEARRALLEGTPELQRLLDAVGRGDSRIVVRDGSGLPVSAPAPSSAGPGTSSGQTGPGTPWSGDLTGGGTGAGRHGAEAGSDQGRRPMPGSTTATDGIPAATSSRTTTETVTGARSGLDVTM